MNKKCFNYKNQQPLWKMDNIKKSNKIIKEAKNVNNKPKERS